MGGSQIDVIPTCSYPGWVRMVLRDFLDDAHPVTTPPGRGPATPRPCGRPVGRHRGSPGRRPRSCPAGSEARHDRGRRGRSEHRSRRRPRGGEPGRKQVLHQLLCVVMLSASRRWRREPDRRSPDVLADGLFGSSSVASQGRPRHHRRSQGALATRSPRPASRIHRPGRLANARSSSNCGPEQADEHQDRPTGGRDLDREQPGESPQNELRDRDRGKCYPRLTGDASKPKPPSMCVRSLRVVFEARIDGAAEQGAWVDRCPGVRAVRATAAGQHK